MEKVKIVSNNIEGKKGATYMCTTRNDHKITVMWSRKGDKP